MKLVSGPAGTRAPSRYVCAGCDHIAASHDWLPFRCPHAGSDDVDHVLVRELDPGAVQIFGGPEDNPFARYRELFHSYHVARRREFTSRDYGTVVREIDEAVAKVDGQGFRTTPFARNGPLSDELGFSKSGGLWIKNETGNVSGSHKARHLMGVMIALELACRAGDMTPAERPPLAIASCGNAALAAAVIARAVDWPIEVMIPPDANARVVERLNALGAELRTCSRLVDQPGDPCYHAFVDRVEEGALPFTCQGNRNALVIEGGATLAYEIASDLAAGRKMLDRVVVQVGGGALASALLQGFRDARALGMLPDEPRLHTVQTRGAAPLARAYERVTARILSRLRADGESIPDVLDDETRAQVLYDHAEREVVAEELRYAATHRSEFMWPWEQEPRSIAYGILDDETYDWFQLVRGMIITGGYPIIVDDTALARATELAVDVGEVPVDPTGAAGLAGLAVLAARGDIDPDESIAVFMTGVDRDA